MENYKLYITINASASVLSNIRFLLSIIRFFLHFFFTTVPPDCLLDRSLGSHEYVTANGIKFHYVTAGDRSKPLMLFLHGFPEVSMPTLT